ncbi:hypothetical protein UPYG_G00273180, partial [Umbra pygmaea]
MVEMGLDPLSVLAAETGPDCEGVARAPSACRDLAHEIEMYMQASSPLSTRTPSTDLQSPSTSLPHLPAPPSPRPRPLSLTQSPTTSPRPPPPLLRANSNLPHSRPRERLRPSPSLPLGHSDKRPSRPSSLVSPCSPAASPSSSTFSIDSLLTPTLSLDTFKSSFLSAGKGVAEKASRLYSRLSSQTSLTQDVNCDQISVSSLTSGDPDSTSLLEDGSTLDPEAFSSRTSSFTSSYASPQHDSITRLRRSPAQGRPTSQSPSTPSRVFRHNSFSGGLAPPTRFPQTPESSAEASRFHLNQQYTTEVLMCSCCRCKTCDCLVYDEEIMAGWMADDSNLNTTCPFCGSPFLPFLHLQIRDLRSSMECRLPERSGTSTPQSPSVERSGTSTPQSPSVERSGTSTPQSPSVERSGTSTPQSPSVERSGTSTPQSPSVERSGTSTPQSPSVERSGTSTHQSPSVERSGTSTHQSPSVERSGTSTPQSPSVERSGTSTPQSHSVERSGTSTPQSLSVERSGTSTPQSPSVERSGTLTPQSPSVERSGTSTHQSPSVERSGTSTHQSPSVERSGTSTHQSPSVERSGTSTPQSPSVERSGTSTPQSHSVQRSGTLTSAQSPPQGSAPSPPPSSALSPSPGSTPSPPPASAPSPTPGSAPCPPVTVPYLSPLVLWKELESLMGNEGDQVLSSPSIVDHHPIVFWNLVWYYRRLELPSNLPGLILASQHCTQRPGLQVPAQSVSSEDSKNVLVRILWDNLELHQDTVQPLYTLWNTHCSPSRARGPGCGEKNAQDHLFPAEVLQGMVRSLQRSDVYQPMTVTL